MALPPSMAELQRQIDQLEGKFFWLASNILDIFVILNTVCNKTNQAISHALAGQNAQAATAVAESQAARAEAVALVLTLKADNPFSRRRSGE